MEEEFETHRVFLLSPANVAGKRAKMLLNPEAHFDLARRLHADGGLPLGEAFAFMSGLYFRGKLAYARAFAQAPQSGWHLSRMRPRIKCAVFPNPGLRAAST